MDGEVEGLGDVVRTALRTQPTDEDLLMMSEKGPSLSDASSCCCTKLQLSSSRAKSCGTVWKDW